MNILFALKFVHSVSKTNLDWEICDNSVKS